MRTSDGLWLVPSWAARKVWVRCGADLARPTRMPLTCGYVALVQGLANPCRQVRRLLDLAEHWPDGLSDEVRTSRPYRLARQLREEEVDELVRTYSAGVTLRELAVQFTVYRTTVSKHLQTRGIDTSPPALTDDQVQAAATLYRQGWTLAQLANKYQAGRETMRKRLRASGVKMRPKGSIATMTAGHQKA